MKSDGTIENMDFVHTSAWLVCITYALMSFDLISVSPETHMAFGSAVLVVGLCYVAGYLLPVLRLNGIVPRTSKRVALLVSTVLWVIVALYTSTVIYKIWCLLYA